MTIHYQTIEEMTEIIQRLVMSGLTFKVTTSTNTIELTGGY
jgi:hypothetical protein